MFQHCTASLAHVGFVVYPCGMHRDRNFHSTASYLGYIQPNKTIPLCGLVSCLKRNDHLTASHVRYLMASFFRDASKISSITSSLFLGLAHTLYTRPLHSLRFGHCVLIQYISFSGRASGSQCSGGMILWAL